MNILAMTTPFHKPSAAPKKINVELIEKSQKWEQVIAPTLSETLRRLNELQRQEGEQQARAWLKNEYYDLEDDEDADKS
jgi:hypothetical protein